MISSRIHRRRKPRHSEMEGLERNRLRRLLYGILSFGFGNLNFIDGLEINGRSSSFIVANLGTNEFNFEDFNVQHGSNLPFGTRIRLSTTGTLPSGLDDQTTYIVGFGNFNFATLEVTNQIHTTEFNFLNGIPVVISDSGSGNLTVTEIIST